MLIAEAFGTCVLVQMGTAANCAHLYLQTITMGTVALVWGLALTIAVYSSAALSGGHINPAITMAFCLVRPADLRFRKVIPYWLAQLLGAVVGGTINLFLFHRAIGHYESKHSIVRGSDAGIASAAAFGDYYRYESRIRSQQSCLVAIIAQKYLLRLPSSLNSKDVQGGVHAFFIEAFGTAVLAFVVFVMTHRKNPIPGAAVPPVIGATLVVLVAALGPLTGCVVTDMNDCLAVCRALASYRPTCNLAPCHHCSASFNPARDMGPRLVTVVARWGRPAMKDFLPYLLAPLIGGPIGAFLADRVLML